MQVEGFGIDEFGFPHDLIQRSVVLDEGEERSQTSSLHLEAIRDTVEIGGDRRTQRCVEVLHELDEHGLLVGEVHVEGALGNARPTRDLAHGGTVVTLFAEDLLGGGPGRDEDGDTQLVTAMSMFDSMGIVPDG